MGALTSTGGTNSATPSAILSTPSSSFVVADNILYSVNDYTGQTHTNRVLLQNGSLADVYLNNAGAQYDEQVVGFYTQEMSPNGHNETTMYAGQVAQEVQYVYAPFMGLSVVCGIFLSQAGQVLGTQVISEAFGGGTSTLEGSP